MDVLPIQRPSNYKEPVRKQRFICKTEHHQFKGHQKSVSMTYEYNLVMQYLTLTNRRSVLPQVHRHDSQSINSS